MGKVVNSRNISIEFKPWTDNGYRIVRLQMIEELGGRIPGGNMYLHNDGSDAALKLVTDQKIGTIYISGEKKGSLNFEIPVFIISRQTLMNVLDIKFVCISDPKFYTDLVTTTYDDINSAIRLAYPKSKKGVDLRTEADSGVLNTREWQNCETGHDFLTRLCYSFKQNTVFAFGWEGLFIKDLCGLKNSFGENEEDSTKLPEINEGAVTFNLEPTQLQYNKRLNRPSYNPWYGQEESGDDMYPLTKKSYANVEPKNVTSIMNYSEYQILGRSHAQHRSNADWNRNLMSGNLYSEFVATSLDMPSFKLGDVVKYTFNGEDSKIPFERYLVKSNEIFWTAEDSEGEVDENGLRFSWTIRFLGLDKGKWNEDVKEEEKEKK